MKVEKNGQGRWAYDMGTMYMEASCHHASGNTHRACGGCYARATETLSKLADQGVPLAKEFIAAVKAEAKGSK